MKRFFCLLAATAFLFCQSALGVEIHLPWENESPLYTGADEHLVVAGLLDGRGEDLINNIQHTAPGGSLTVSVAAPRGANLSTQVMEGGVNTTIKPIIRAQEGGVHQYDYHLLIITCPESHQVDEDSRFRIGLHVGEKTVNLRGTCRPATQQTVAGGVTYRLYRGYRFLVPANLSEPSVIDCGGLSVTIPGNKFDRYEGPKEFSLRLSRESSVQPEGLRAVWRFLDTPSFETPVQIAVKAQPTDRLVLQEGSHLRALPARYENGALHLTVETLGTYLLLSV